MILKIKVMIKELILFSINFKSKKTSLNNYQYISTIPSKKTQTFQSRSGRVSSDTTYYSSITLYKKRLRGGLEINKYRSTKESTEIAVELSKRLDVVFFTYSPKVIREKMRE